MSNQITKSRYWWAVLYPENMLPDWEEKIADLVQIPYAYCVHDFDHDSQSEHRKDHVHCILVFSNTTTYNHAFKVFDQLSAPGSKALNTIQACVSIRYCYDYLIHDTEACRNSGKFQYPADLRITGNNFDIGCYEQLSLEEKQLMRDELSDFTIDNQIMNYALLYIKVVECFPPEYKNILSSYSSHFERLCKGNYQLYAVHS